MDILTQQPNQDIDRLGKWVTGAFFVLLWGMLLYPMWKLVAPA